MQALLALAALLALLGPGLLVGATFGDNGLTTYTGRKREPNTLVFGNDMVTEQALQVSTATMQPNSTLTRGGGAGQIANERLNRVCSNDMLLAGMHSPVIIN
jgi:hypothetical protein